LIQAADGTIPRWKKTVTHRQVPHNRPFEPCLDALSLWSDGISSIQFLSLSDSITLQDLEEMLSLPPAKNYSLADSRLMFGIPSQRSVCFEKKCLNNGSSQGQNLVLTVLCVPYLLDIGLANTDVPARQELLSR